MTSPIITPEFLDQLLAQQAAEASLRADRIAAQQVFTVTLTVTDPVDGALRTYTDHYAARAGADPRWAFDIYTYVPETGAVREGGYETTGDLDAWKAVKLAKMAEQGARWVKDMQWGREQAAVVARYNAEVLPVLLRRLPTRPSQSV